MGSMGIRWTGTGARERERATTAREQFGRKFGRAGSGVLGVGALLCALLLAAALAGCRLGGSGTQKTSTAKPDLTTLPWCDQPYLNFVDDSTQAQTPIDWSQASDQLGFTLYLPASLPKGSCLVLAGGSIHDPIYGAHVSLTWDLAPDLSPLSFSEAPRRGAASRPQCEASSQDAKVSVCLGSIKDTSITIVSKQSPAQLEAVFNALQPNVEWMPSDTQNLLATPSATAASS